MAYIGMRYPVAAPVSSHTDGSAITYGTGFVIGHAVAANISFDVNDNPDYGDDIMIDNDTGISGYNGDIDLNGLAASVRASLLGWDSVSSGTPAAITHYEVSDETTPEMGWGFIHVGMLEGVKSYEAYWFHKSRFTQNNISASTKKKQIEWNHPKLNFVGEGAYIDSTGKAKYFDWMSFESEASAKAWLNTKAGIS